LIELFRRWTFALALPGVAQARNNARFRPAGVLHARIAHAVSTAATMFAVLPVVRHDVVRQLPEDIYHPIELTPPLDTTSGLPAVCPNKY